jgi:hypothetical protein
MQRDVAVALAEERDAIANQDGQYRIADFVSEPFRAMKPSRLAAM